MSLAYRLRNNAGDEAKTDGIILEIIKKQGTNGSTRGGIPYSLYGTNNSYWEMKNQNCVSSTGWLVMAIGHWNAFRGEKIENGITRVSTPVINPGGGSFSAPVSVEISCATRGARIYYTTDGSTPSDSSAVYTGPITIFSAATLKSMAKKEGLADSEVAVEVYTFNSTVNAPVISPAGGTYEMPVELVMTTSTNGAAVTMRNKSWNAVIAPGQSISVGMQGNHPGTFVVPAGFTVH